jgi:LPS O-antigen subunit length determinant protein (WzzB/FepE family)
MTSYQVTQAVDAEPSQITRIVSQGWKWLVSAAALGFCAAYAASYLMQPAYRADVIVLPENRAAGQEDSMFSGLVGDTGVLGGLAGLGTGTPDRIEFLETLRSAGTARNFVREQGLIGIICGAHFATCYSRGEGAAESNENAALLAFRRHILDVAEDKNKGIVRVTITWTDRKLAATWANDYVALANHELQGKAVAQARQRVGFLQRAASATEDQDLRSAIYKLMESQVRVEMLASTRPDYAFRIIDSAVPSDRRHPVRPLRALIAAIGGVAAFALTYASLFVRLSRRARRGQSSAETNKEA